MARAWLRLGRVAAIGVIAALSIAGGTLFPQAQTAAAQGVHSGYTYTQRVCQELGQQPRHYQVRDPIAGSDWRSDGGWAIVLERGFGRPARYVPASEDIVAPGVTPSFGTHIGDGTRFVRNHWSTAWYLPSPWRTDQAGRFVKLYNNGDDSDYVRAWSDDSRARNRYNQIPAIVSGQYIRWANVLWCR